MESHSPRALRIGAHLASDDFIPRSAMSQKRTTHHVFPQVVLLRTPFGLAVTAMRRQHAQGRHQDVLRLLLPYWPSAPALAHRPLAHAPLKPRNFPHPARDICRELPLRRGR